MKTPNSDFFQPFLRQERPLKDQLAAEILVNRLDESLAKGAQECASKYPPQAVKATAHALENIVLRHAQPGEWTAYLQHEIERKSGNAQTLLKDVKSWLSDQPGQPVTSAWEDAVKNMRLDYQINQSSCPLSDLDLKSIRTALYPTVLREFLANMLGRLTE